MEILLLSNTTNHGGSPLEHASAAIQDWAGEVSQVLFIPYALKDQAAYLTKIRDAFRTIGVTTPIVGINEVENPRQLLETTEAVFVGGGNSFRLLNLLDRTGMLDVLRRRVLSGNTRYMGSSAGTNMACPTIRTTNDMPIVEPRSLNALALVPFQINPHYLDENPDLEFMGESRETRILEFLEENDTTVLGLREGCWIRRSASHLIVNGPSSSTLRVFTRAGMEELAMGCDLSNLLSLRPMFDLEQ